MKIKNIFGLLINPFTRIAGWKAFFVGLFFVLLMGIIGTYSGIIFDGALDMHFANNLTFAKSFTALIVSIFSIVGVMSLVALVVSKDFRFIDILGTMTLAKASLFLLSFGGFLVVAPTVHEVLALMTNPDAFQLPVRFIVVTILSIPFIVWNVVLMYNALKVSCNLKGSTLAISFIIGIILSEILSKVLLYILFKNIPCLM